MEIYEGKQRREEIRNGWEEQNIERKNTKNERRGEERNGIKNGSGRSENNRKNIDTINKARLKKERNYYKKEKQETKRMQ